MPSLALQAWTGVRAANLDLMQRAHRALRGSGAGVRDATLQINQAYAVLLSAQFQAFCRDLHTEGVEHLTAGISDPDLRTIVRANTVRERKLDRGNPNPGNIGADFGRLGLVLWPAVVALRPLNGGRQALLQTLNDWRNAIAHHDFTAAMLRRGRPNLPLTRVRTWRGACHGLAESFDEVMRRHLLARNGVTPW